MSGWFGWGATPAKETKEKQDKEFDPTKDTSVIDASKGEAENMIKGLVEAVDSPVGQNGWVGDADLLGLKVAKRTTKDSPLQSIRGSGTIKYNMKAMIPKYRIWEEYKKWDTMFIDGKHIEKKTEGDIDYEIVMQQYRSPPMIANRDVALFGVIKFLEDGRWVAAYKSVVTDKIPVDPNYVRAEVMASGFVMKLLGEDLVEVTYVVQMDPKGWLPTWAINATAAEQAKVVANMRTVLEGEKAGGEKKK